MVKTFKNGSILYLPDVNPLMTTKVFRALCHGWQGLDRLILNW